MSRTVITLVELILLLVVFPNLLTGWTEGYENTAPVARKRRDDSAEAWNYENQDDWADMGYDECNGQKQSPIYCRREDSDWTYIPDFEYSNYDMDRDDAVLKNNGKTISVTLSDESNIPSVEKGDLYDTYYFEQVLFRFGSDDDAGAEHNSQKFDAGTSSDWPPLKSAFEIQIFHKNTNAEAPRYFVISSIFTAGDESQYNVAEGLKPIVEAIPEVIYANQEAKLQNFNLAQLIPGGFKLNYAEYYYRYNGSLTYPPCTENVMWNILREEEVFINPDTLKEFRKLQSTPEGDDNPQPMANNYRKQQDFNGRYLIDRKPFQK